MKMYSIIFFIKSLLLFLHIALNESKIQTFKFATNFCSSPGFDVILKASSVSEKIRRSFLHCVSSCGQSDQCNFAIYRQSTHMCRHVFSYQGQSSNILPSYTTENGCLVLRKNSKPLCKNGGNFTGNDACRCLEDFEGRECEVQKHNFCTLNSWREATSTDFAMLAVSKLHTKIMTQKNSATKITDVNFFAVSNGLYRLESHNFLVVNGEAFDSDLKREFNFYAQQSGTMTTKKVTMTGIVTSDSDSSLTTKLLIRDAIDASRTAYEANVNENMAHLISRLYSGHRLINRDSTRTDFNFTTEDVIFHSPKKDVGAKTYGFISPLYFFATKTYVKQKYRSISRWYISSGLHMSSQIQAFSQIIDLDQCWMKMPSNFLPEETLNLMSDLVLSQGKEIRLIMAASTASDVTMVTVTDTDIVVVLADYLTPSSENSYLGSSTKIRFSSVSLSKTLTECEMTFQGSTVHHLSNNPITSTLEWVVSSRHWVQTLQITPAGLVLSGSHNDVYTAAVSGRTIRVCVEVTANVSVCFSGLTLNLDDNTKHVILQSPAALVLDLNPDRTMFGVVGPDCKRRHYLVSTKGWVNQASFTIGVADPVDAVVQVNCLKTTWFQQK